MILPFQTLKDTFYEILIRYDFPEQQAGEVSRIFAETTLDGVFSHGINRFPRFIEDVRKGTVKPGVEPERKGGFSALEQWDGKKGAGITNALFCTDRSIELASGFGIGCVGLANTNHWMRGGSYGWIAAEKGFMFMGWTNTLPNMPPWGGKVPALGNNPFILAIPHKEGHIVLDMAMSQYSKPVQSFPISGVITGRTALPGILVKYSSRCGSSRQECGKVVHSRWSWTWLQPSSPVVTQLRRSGN